MLLKQNNHAYIDAANLHQATKKLGWSIDYVKLRIWLREKHYVSSAYMFVGFLPENEALYRYLKKCGFNLIFKEILLPQANIIKGNCDGDLILKAVCDTYENKYDKAVIISSDGDFTSLIDFLNKMERLRIILSPHNNCSLLIKRLGLPVTYLRDIRMHIERST